MAKTKEKEVPKHWTMNFSECRNLGDLVTFLHVNCDPDTPLTSTAKTMLMMYLKDIKRRSAESIQEEQKVLSEASRSIKNADADRKALEAANKTIDKMEKRITQLENDLKAVKKDSK